MIIKLSEKLAVSIKNANPEQTASIEVMKYALLGIFNTVGTILLSAVIGLLTGELAGVATAFFAFAILRFFSGGIHLSSPVSCILVSSLIICAIPYIPTTPALELVLMIISTVLIFIYAPSNVKGFARLPEKYFPILKLISLLIVSSNWFFGSTIITVAFFLQSISLIRFQRGDIHES
jgi:accessory gene regulator B